MSKQKIIQNNIEFLVDNVGGYLLPAKLTLMGNNSYSNYKVVNAIDIDWNEVDLGSGKISDTGLLIKEIKDLKDRPSTLKQVEKIAVDLADFLISEKTRDFRDYLYNLPQCITRDPVNQFYNNVFYDDSTTESLVLNYDIDVERIIKPFPVFIISSGINTPNVLLKLYEDSNYVKEVPFVKTNLLPGEYIDKVREREDTDYLAIFNLIPNKEYWYKADGDDPIGGSFKTSGVRRLLYIDKATSIHNFRDLGGLKAIGGTIKYGKVIRGTLIDDITETGIALLKAIGINYELDLRLASEITANDLSSQGIDLINTPFITFDAAILNTDAAKTSVRTAFEAFIGALNEDKNILVHCSGGKDRTGLFCFLLEALLGCSRDTIDKDYELSALYKAESFKLNLRSANTSFYNYLGFLSFLNNFDGYTLLEKVRNYLIQCNITPLYLDIIKLKLILKEEFTNDDLNVAISKETEAGVALDIPSNAASLALHALDYADLAADAADLAKDYAKAVKDYLLEFSESQDIDATIAALLAENAGDIADLQAELVKTREKALGVLGNGEEDTIQYEPYKDFVKYVEFTSTTNNSSDWNVTEARKATSRYLDELAIPKNASPEVWTTRLNIDFEDEDYSMFSLSSDTGVTLGIVTTANGSKSYEVVAIAGGTRTVTLNLNSVNLGDYDLYKFSFDWNTGGSNQDPSILKVKGFNTPDLLTLNISGGGSNTAITFEANGETLASYEAPRTLETPTSLFHFLFTGDNSGVYLTVTKDNVVYVNNVKIYNSLDRITGIENALGRSYNHTVFDNIKYTTCKLPSLVNIDKYLNDPRFSSAIIFTNQNRVHVNHTKFKNIPIGFININSWALSLLAYNIYVGASNTADDGAPNICLNWVLIVFNGLLYRVNPSTGGLMRVPDDYIPIEGEELFIGPASATYDAGIYTRVYRNNKWSAWKEYSTRKLLTAIDDVKTEIRNLDTATENKLQRVNTSIEDTLKLARRFSNYAILTKAPLFYIGKYTTRTEVENGLNVTYYNNDDMASVTFPIGTTILGFKNGSNITLLEELVFKWNRDAKITNASTTTIKIGERVVSGNTIDINRIEFFDKGATYASSYLVLKKTTDGYIPRIIQAYRFPDLEEDEAVLALVRWTEDLIDCCCARDPKLVAPIFKNYPLPAPDKPFRVLDIGNSYTLDTTSCLTLIFTNLGIDTSNLCLYIMVRGNASFKTWTDIYNNNDTSTISIYNYIGGFKLAVTPGDYYIQNHTWYRPAKNTDTDIVTITKPDGTSYSGVEIQNQLFEVLNNNTWDLILIHSVSSQSADIGQYDPSLRDLISILRRHLPQCTIGTYLIHSYDEDFSSNLERNSYTRWKRNSDSVKLLLNLGIDVVIPYGTAIENLRTVKEEINTNYTSYFNDINGNQLPFKRDDILLAPEEIDDIVFEGFIKNNLTRDNTHLGTGLARYTAACTYYLAIFAPYTGISVLSKGIQDLPTSSLTREEYKNLNKKYSLLDYDNSIKNSAYNINSYPNAITDCLDVNSYNAKLAEKAAIWACGDMHNVHNPIEEPISEDIKSHTTSISNITEPNTIYSNPSILYFNRTINPNTGEAVDLENYIVTGFLDSHVKFKFTLEEKTKEVNGEIITYNADKYYIASRYIYDSNYNYIGLYTYGTEQASYRDRIIAREGDHMRFVIKPVGGNLQEGDSVFEYIYNSTNTGSTIHIEHTSDEFNFPYAEEYFLDAGNTTTIMTDKLDCKYVYIDAKVIYADFAFRFFLQNNEGQVQTVNRALNKRSALLAPTTFGELYSGYKFIGFTLVHRPQSAIERDNVDSYLPLAINNTIKVLDFNIILLQDALDLLKIPEKRIYKNVVYNTTTNKLEDSDKRCTSSFVPVNTFINTEENFLTNACMAFDADYNYLGKEVDVTVAGNTLEKATNIIKKSKYYIYQYKKVDNSIIRLNDNLEYTIQETYPENVNAIKNVSTSGYWYGIGNSTEVNAIGYDYMPAFRINSKELTITVRNIGIYSANTIDSIQRPIRQNNYWCLKYFYINTNNEPSQGFYLLNSVGTYTLSSKATWKSNILGFSVYCWCTDAEENYDAVIDITVAWDEAGTGQLLSSDSGTQIVSGTKINTNNRYIGAIFFDAWNNNDPYKDAHPESLVSYNNNSNVNSVDNLNLHVLAPYGNTFSGGVDGFMARSLWLFELIDLDRTFEDSLYSPYPKFHLNAIKVASDSISGQVTSIKVVDKNNQERDLLVEDFKCWDSSQKNSVEATMPPIPIEVNTNTTVSQLDLVAGFENVGAYIYAKLTLYKKIVITGTPNLKLRLLYNRFSDDNNEAMLERILTINNMGSIEFKPIDDYKSSEAMPIVPDTVTNRDGYFDVYNKKVRAFRGDLVNPLSGIQEKFILRDWCDFCYDVFGETPVRLCSIVDFFASKGLTLKDSNGNSLIPISVVSNMPMEFSDDEDRVSLGWRNTNTVALLEKLIDIASDYGLDYFIFHLYTAYTFNEDNTINREKFIMANRGLYNFIAANNSYKMKFCVSMSSSHVVANDLGKSKERTHNLIKFIYDELISKPNYLYVNGGPIICHYYGSSEINSSTLKHNLEFYKSYNKIANTKILKNNIENNYLTGIVANGVWKYSGFPSYGIGIPGGSNYTSNATLMINHTYIALKTDTINGVKRIFNHTEPIEIIPVTTGYGNYNRSGGLNGNNSETPTKEEFLEALKEAIDFAETANSEDKLISIYAWNEFCEGGSLLPKQSEVDANRGFAKLEAVLEAKEYWESLPKV